MAQEVLGSGIVPSVAENSSERSVGFATQIADGASLVVVMTSAEIDRSLPFDRSGRASIAAAMESGGFEGKSGQMLEVYGIPSRPLVLLVGAADAQADLDWRDLGGEISQRLTSKPGPWAIAGVPGSRAMANVGFGATLGQYRFD